MIAEKWNPVFARDKRVTRLRDDHARTRRDATMIQTERQKR
jgi:hypothetical protein